MSLWNTAISLLFLNRKMEAEECYWFLAWSESKEWKNWIYRTFIFHSLNNASILSLKQSLNAFQWNGIFLNRLTNPSSPGPGKVTARFRPFSSKAFISMPKLDSGCLSQFCNTVFTSILCQIPVPGFMSSFKDRIPVYLVPSFMGLISLRICTNTVVGFWTCLKYIHNCAFTTLLYCILELNLKKQHFGFPSICTRKSAINEWKE